MMGADPLQRPHTCNLVSKICIFFNFCDEIRDQLQQTRKTLNNVISILTGSSFRAFIGSCDDSRDV